MILTDWPNLTGNSAFASLAAMWGHDISAIDAMNRFVATCA